jgi:hypothetical protein
MRQFLLVMVFLAPALATLFLGLRLSAFRKDLPEVPRYFARPYTTLRDFYRAENYREEGRYLLDWLAVTSAVATFAMFFVLAFL